jgi:hypothetical protein
VRIADVMVSPAKRAAAMNILSAIDRELATRFRR